MKPADPALRRAHALAFGAAFLVAFVTAAVAACSSSHGTAFTAPDAANGACTNCVTDQDCNGGVCAQFGGDSFCAAACPNGNECDPDHACTQESTVSGDQASVCVPTTTPCGDGTTTSPPSTPPSSDTCGSLVGPSVAAKCNSCTGTTQTCAANGCYGGWWCNTATNKCQSPPTNCSTGDGGAFHVDGGPVVGSVDQNGGKVSRLYFAVVGDTRPAVINDTPAYPSAVIGQIWADVEASTPRPTFAISTGDYIFTSPTSTSGANAQFDLYLTARKQYSNIVFPAMGNHECTGQVTSNCGQGNTDGVTANYTAFTQKLLTPIGKTSPNYEVDIDSQDGSWTSKFVFIAGNSWTSADATWLDGALARATTYTFIVRHEPKNANNAPGCGGSEPIMANHPYTLAIVGHTHTYDKSGAKQVTIGNGGAPLVSGTNYGFGIVSQRSDGAIVVDMVDYQTGKTDPVFHFALTPDGRFAPP